MGLYEDGFKKMFGENFQEYYKNVRHGFEKQDQLTVWVAGFNIAAIALLVSQNDKLHFSHCVIKFSILTFCLSLLSAIAYRIISIMLLVRWAIAGYLISFYTYSLSVDLTEEELKKERDEFIPKHEKYINDLLGLTEKQIQNNKDHPKKMFPLAFVCNFFHKLTFIVFGIAVLVLCLAF